MSGWDSTKLLRYMSDRSNFYGKDWSKISAAEHSFLAKCFTDSVLTHLDLSSQVALPFVHIKYEGKGDPCGVKIDPDYCFTDDQINKLMTFLCCKDGNDTPYPYFFSAFDSFVIEVYLLHGMSLYSPYLSFLRATVQNSPETIKSYEPNFFGFL